MLFAFGLDPDPILESCDDPKEAVLVKVVGGSAVRPKRCFTLAKLHAPGQVVSAHPQAVQVGILGVGGQQGFLQLQLNS